MIWENIPWNEAVKKFKYSMIPILKKNKQKPHQNQIKACTYRPHERKGGEKVTENRAEGNMAH